MSLWSNWFIGCLWIVFIVGYEPEAPLPRIHFTSIDFINLRYGLLAHCFVERQEAMKETSPALLVFLSSFFSESMDGWGKER